MSIDERLQNVFRVAFADDSLMISSQFSPDDRDDWDSVASINLMFLVEQEFDVHFKGSEFMEFNNVGEILAYLRRVSH
jgi:acyl carrier protein